MIGTTDVVERVVYHYFNADDKAGNVRRVARKVADVPGPDPINWTVYGTDFDYHRNGEVRMIIQRTWRDDGGSVSNDQLVSIHEVRGNGRARYMLRPWGFAPDGQGGWNTWADNASALWTTYDGGVPTADYRMIDQPTLGLVPYPETSYTLGLAQRTPAGEVKYFHTDHLGTTQAMTDGSQAVNPRVVYTAFGEVIQTEGTVDTRYQYAGGDGYETFDALPFLHLGARWYDPGSGRFLQRDLIGIRGGYNVYSYAKGNPLGGTDPDGRMIILRPPRDGQVWPWKPRTGIRLAQGILVGLFSGAVYGAIGGAVAGSAAAGVGAGPGAIVGGIAGAITGTLQGICTALTIDLAQEIIEGIQERAKRKPKPPKKGGGFRWPIILA